MGKGVGSTSETKIQERKVVRVMKGLSEDPLIKWVHVMIKMEETWHRTIGLLYL